jgi:Raf kinase inhibitor-like YbhB/YbcL family protein
MRAASAVAVAVLVWAAAPVHAQSSGVTPPPAPRPAARGIRPITLTSTAFESGGLIPDRHAQMGRDVSPALVWSGAPDSTRSFVLLVHDLDAPTAPGTDDALHWLVWNIPGSAKGLPEGVPSGAQRDGVRQISVSGPYYRGPAAPASGPMHHYVFELYALDNMVNVPPTTLSPALTRAEVLRAIESHVIGKGVLVGRYRRPAPTER